MLWGWGRGQNRSEQCLLQTRSLSFDNFHSYKKMLAKIFYSKYFQRFIPIILHTLSVASTILIVNNNLYSQKRTINIYKLRKFI